MLNECRQCCLILTTPLGGPTSLFPLEAQRGAPTCPESHSWVCCLGSWSPEPTLPSLRCGLNCEQVPKAPSMPRRSSSGTSYGAVAGIVGQDWGLMRPQGLSRPSVKWAQEFTERSVFRPLEPSPRHPRGGRPSPISETILKTWKFFPSLEYTIGSWKQARASSLGTQRA